jgi:hypothetical protein
MTCHSISSNAVLIGIEGLCFSALLLQLCTTMLSKARRYNRDAGRSGMEFLLAHGNAIHKISGPLPCSLLLLLLIIEQDILRADEWSWQLVAEEFVPPGCIPEVTYSLRKMILGHDSTPKDRDVLQLMTAVVIPALRSFGA